MSEPVIILSELDQLLTYSELAEVKGMGQSLLAYHLAKPDAPKPVLIGFGRHRYYRPSEVAAWEPKRSPTKGRKRRGTH